MKLLQIYNQYRSLFGGEENVILKTADLIEEHGGSTKLLMRSSRGLDHSLPKKIKAFFSGIYSFEAKTHVSNVLKEFQPDIVHAHNLAPLFSPSVLVACKRAGIPIVLSLHNFSQTCPNGNHLNKGHVCERCVKSGEICCVLRNCRGSFAENTTYAMRSYLARKARWYTDNVDRFICLTEFSKNHLIKASFESSQIRVLPNMVNLKRLVTDPSQGKYVAFAGRMDVGKGVKTLLKAAEKIRHVPFSLAGDGPELEQYKTSAPSNVHFLGQLDKQEMEKFYSRARMVVVPSNLYEMCPLVISEAMSHGLPVIGSYKGGIPELIDNRKTGLTFKPGSVDELVGHIVTLWEDTQLCQKYGTNGREKAVHEYGEETYYRRLSAIYDELIKP